MQASRRFALPPAPRTPLRWIAVAVAVEALFVAALVLFRTPYGGTAPERTFAYLLDVPSAPRAQPPAGRGRPAAPPPEAPRLITPRPAVVAVRQPASDAGTQQALRPFLADSMERETGGGVLASGSLAALRPGFGDGRLWVRPTTAYEWPTTSRAINLDSVVRLRLLAMADSIERYPSVNPNRPARWIFERNGRQYGMDENGNLHLGVITIPGALLALIPMPQGNIDQARNNARLAAMRADIMRAAARAQAEDDFRRAVKEIRERQARERQERRERERQQQGGERPIP